jgi:hypothetical protein
VFGGSAIVQRRHDGSAAVTTHRQRAILTKGQPFAAKRLKEDLQPPVLKPPNLGAPPSRLDIDYFYWGRFTAQSLRVVSKNLLVTFSDYDHFTLQAPRAMTDFARIRAAASFGRPRHDQSWVASGAPCSEATGSVGLEGGPAAYLNFRISRRRQREPSECI